jgi:ADP-ribose pyrophosphatase YjhB (NUDIX family)
MGKLYSTSVQIRDPRGNYLWIRRSSTAPSRAGQYEHPGGHAERGETAKEAARRETREETGIKIRDDELRVVERTPGPKGDHVTFSYTIPKAVRPKLSFEHDHFVWSPQAPALSNGFLSKYMQGKDTSAMTTEQKAKGVAVSVGTKAVTRTVGKAIAKKMAAQAAARVAVKGATAGTGIGVFVTGGMMVADAAPEAWAVTKETLAVPGQISRQVREAKGLSGKLKAAASGSGKAFVDLNLAPLRVGAASIFGSGTVKMAREAAGEAMAARKAKQNGIGEAMVRGMGRAAGYAPQITKHAGTILTEGGKLVGLAATTLIGGTVAVKTARSAWKDAKKNPSSIATNVAEINKMLKNMPTDWQMQLGVNRAKLRAAGADSSQLPPVVPNAHNVLLALNLNNRGAVSSEAAAGQEPTSGKTVPDDVREAAMEGVRLSFKNNYGGYNFIGLGRAIQLAISPKISDAALNRMRMYFDRKTKQDRLSEQYTNKHGKRYWSWLNWGGDPGARWSKSTRFAELVGRAGPMRQSVPSARPRRAVLVKKKNPVLESLDSGMDSSAPLTQYSIQAANTMSRRSSHNPFDNPYYKEQAPGSRCFYIYNDDGTQVTGPTGPKFCFSEEKAKEMVAKAERAGFRVSPSSVSPGPRHTTAPLPPPYRAPVSGPVRYIESRFELLRPILNHHLVMSVERPHRGGEGATGVAPTVKGIHPRIKYAVIHSGIRASGKVRPEFVVDMATMEISRADYDGLPREGWNYGTIDEVIERGRTLKPRENPYTADQQPFADLAPNVEGTMRCAVCNGTGVEDDGRLCMDCSGTGRVAEWKQRKQRRQGAGTIQAMFRSGKAITMTPAQVLKMPTMFTSATVEAAKKAIASARGRQNPSYGTLVEDRIRLRDMLEELPQPEKTKKSQVAQVRGSRGKKKKSRSNPGPGFTPTEWFADVEDSEWANWDLNRAGIMHYSGSGIPTYKSIVKSNPFSFKPENFDQRLRRMGATNYKVYRDLETGEETKSPSSVTFADPDATLQALAVFLALEKVDVRGATEVPSKKLNQSTVRLADGRVFIATLGPRNDLKIEMPGAPGGIDWFEWARAGVYPVTSAK